MILSKLSTFQFFPGERVSCWLGRRGSRPAVWAAPPIGCLCASCDCGGVTQDWRPGSPERRIHWKWSRGYSPMLETRAGCAGRRGGCNGAPPRRAAAAGRAAGRRAAAGRAAPQTHWKCNGGGQAGPATAAAPQLGWKCNCEWECCLELGWAEQRGGRGGSSDTLSSLPSTTGTLASYTPHTKHTDGL